MGDQMKTIVEFITLSEIGGAQIVVKNIIDNLKNKFNFYLVTSGRDYLVKYFENDPQVEVLLLDNLFREVSLINDIKSIIEFNKIINKINPDIIHAHSSKAGMISKIIKFFNRESKLYFTVHGFASSSISSNLKSKIFDYIEKQTSFIIDKSIFVSNNDLKYAKKTGWSSKEMEVIYNGIEKINWSSKNLLQNKILENNKEKKIGVTIARLSKQKNPIKFLKFLKEERSKLYNFFFIWIGEGPLESQCRQYIEENDLKDLIYLTGKIVNAKKYIKKFDFFFLLSLWECLPVSIIEALQAKLPIIATNVGGVNEMVDKKNGILIPKNYYHNDLLKALNLIYNNNLNEMKNNSFYKYKKNFKINKMTKEYLRIFN